MEDLSLTLIQSDLHWENATANLAMFEEKIWTIGSKSDIIVLPEMFSTGFSMNASTHAELINQTTFKWMKQMASQSGSLLIGSFIAKENARFYNRLIWMQPDGEYKLYDKRHLFRMAHEDETYSSGNSRLVASWKGWNICPLVCYDLRFPVWSRNNWISAENRLEYDLLIYVANWPEARISAWDTLLKARAIENLSYSAGVNRTGNDGKGIPHNGHSAVIGPKGEIIFSAGESESIKTVKISASELMAYRAKFPAYLDADKFSL